MIHLHTLGDCLIKVDEKEIRPTSPLLFAALLYLGMERGRRVPRAALQEMFFPNADERSGAHSVRQLLYKLRQLGVAVRSEGEAIFLPLEDVADDSIAEELILSAGRLKGGFLPGFNSQMSDVFTDWLEDRRAVVEADIRRVLVEQLSTYRNRAEWREVEKLARVVLSFDPLNEEATLALAEAIALAGGKAEAVRMLRTYEQETGSNSAQLPARILRQRISEHFSAPQQQHRLPFVGRSGIVARLRQSLSEALATNGRTMAILGEPGIGKSRLLEEVLALASLEGLNVFVSSCKPHQSSRPLGVLIELVPQLLNAPGALGVSPNSLQQLLSLSRYDATNSESSADHRDDVTRSRVIRASVRDLLAAVCTEKPSVIAVDDAQWLDGDSLRELCAMSSCNQCPLIVVLTARALDPEASTYLKGAGAHVERLGPLPPEAMVELSRHLLRGLADEMNARTAIDRCVRRAGGNPLYLRMLCADIGDRDSDNIPRDLLSTITSRIEQLPSTACKVLEYSALLGRNASRQAMLDLLRLSSYELVESIRCLEEEGFLQLDAEGAHVAHDLVAEATLSLLKPATRACLHDGVARYLEARYEVTHSPSVLWDCADHWVQSGDAAKATEFIRRCAQHTLELGYAAAALTMLQRAEKFASRPQDKTGLLLDMLLPAKMLTQWRVVREIAERYERLTAGERSALHGSHEILHLEARWELGDNILDDARRLRLCVLADDAPLEHRADALLLLLRVAHDYARPDIAQDVYEAFETLLPSIDTHAAHVAPLIYHTSFGRRDTAIEITRKVLAALPTMRNYALRMRTASNVGLAFFYLGLEDEACELDLRCFAEAKRFGLMEWQLEFGTRLCWHYLDQEEYEAASAWLENWQAAAAHCDLGARAKQQLLGAQSEVAMWRGDYAQAQRCYEELCAISTTGSKRVEFYVRAFPIRFRQKCGDFECDDASLAMLHDLHAASREQLIGDFVLIALVAALVHRGDAVAARSLLAEHLSRRPSDSRIPPSLLSLTERCGIEELV